MKEKYPAKSKKNTVLLPKIKSKVQKNDYIFVLDQEFFSSNKINSILFQAKCKNFDAFFSKSSILKLIIPENEDIKGPLLVITSNNLSELLDFIRSILSPESDYYKQKDIIKEDYIVAPIVTNLKAGQSMSFFQKYTKVKVNRGNLEIVEPFTIKQGTVVDANLQKVFSLLNLKIKTKTLKLLGAYKKLRKFQNSKSNFLLNQAKEEFSILKDLINKISRSSIPSGIDLRLSEVIKISENFKLN